MQLTTSTIANLAFLCSLAAAPATAGLRLGEQLDAIRLSGSEHMMVHMLSLKGLPPQARVARDKLLKNMGLRGAPGSVGGSALQFSPIMTHDGNINGGFASDGFTVDNIPFTIGKEYRAVSGLVIGVTGSGRSRISLGNATTLDLSGGVSIGYAPEHDMVKTSVGASACVNRMFSYSTYGHVCLDASHRSYDLGENTRVGSKLGANHVFISSVGVHEISAELQFNRHLDAIEYSQTIASLKVTSTIPGPYAITAGVQLGERVDGVKAMRERAFVSLGFTAFNHPTSVSLSMQNNRGGMWLGENLSESAATLGVSCQVSKKLTVSASATMIDSSASFFDDTQYGVNFAWRF